VTQHVTHDTNVTRATSHTPYGRRLKKAEEDRMRDALEGASRERKEKKEKKKEQK
jgi:hypothetical protein